MDIPTLPMATLEGEMNLPLVGFGTSRVKKHDTFHTVLDAGYPLIDMASVMIGTEPMVGDVISERIDKGIMKREDVIICTKLAPVHMYSSEHVKMGIEASLSALNTDYIDLYAIDCPCALQYIDDRQLWPKNGGFMDYDYVKTWKALEPYVEDGVIGALGVSNFNLQQIDRVMEVARVPVANQQVEIHAYHAQDEMVRGCHERGITVTSYASLGSLGMVNVGSRFRCDNAADYCPLSNPEVSAIAAKHGKTPGQVLLRQLTQRNIAVIPKSETPNRIKENFELFDFTLDEKEMEVIHNLNKNKRTYSMRGLLGHPHYPFETEQQNQETDDKLQNAKK